MTLQPAIRVQFTDGGRRLGVIAVSIVVGVLVIGLLGGLYSGPTPAPANDSDAEPTPAPTTVADPVQTAVATATPTDAAPTDTGMSVPDVRVSFSSNDSSGSSDARIVVDRWGSATAVAYASTASGDWDLLRNADSNEAVFREVTGGAELVVTAFYPGSIDEEVGRWTVPTVQSAPTPTATPSETQRVCGANQEYRVGGPADCYETLAGAVSAAKRDSVDSATIRLATGTYTTETIRLDGSPMDGLFDGGYTIRAADDADVTITPANDGVLFDVPHVSGSSGDVRFVDVTLSGAATAISYNHTGELRLQNSTIRDSTTGIRSSDGKTVVENTVLIGNNVGVEYTPTYGAGATDLEVRNSVIRDHAEYGFYRHAATEANGDEIWRGNTFENNAVGIYFEYDDSLPVTITDNTFTSGSRTTWFVAVGESRAFDQWDYDSRSDLTDWCGAGSTRYITPIDVTSNSWDGAATPVTGTLAGHTFEADGSRICYVFDGA